MVGLLKNVISSVLRVLGESVSLFNRGRRIFAASEGGAPISANAIVKRLSLLCYIKKLLKVRT